MIPVSVFDKDKGGPMIMTECGVEALKRILLAHQSQKLVAGSVPKLTEFGGFCHFSRHQDS